MKGAGPRTHDGFARCGTDDAGLLVGFSAYRGSSRYYGICPHAELLRGVERREKMQVTELAVGLTDLCVCTTGWHRGKSLCERSISSGRKAIR